MSRLRLESDELLDAFFWLADVMLRPTSLITGSEPGAYRRLTQSGYLSRERIGDGSEDAGWVWRLTQKGRSAAAGANDPMTRWERPWDGKWRMLLFDLPAERKSERVALWRWLRKNRFGMLQRSVWVTPDALPELGDSLANLLDAPGSITVFEGNPALPGADNDRAVSRQAWDFDAINELYREYLAILAARPGTSEPKRLRQWKSDEFRAWRAVKAMDPLLPKALLPDDFLGFEAWKTRASHLAGRASPQR